MTTPPESPETPERGPEEGAASEEARARQANALFERFPALRGLAVIRRKRIPFIQQTAATDCGPACLTMVLGYFGRSVRLEEVREAMGFSRLGTDALTLVETARYFGLTGRGVKVRDIDDLQYLDPGAILHWRFSHFVVFERLVKRGAWVVDPGAGRRLVLRSELDRAFTGVAGTFEPGEDFQKVPAGRSPVWGYLRQILSQSGLLSRVMVTSLVNQLFALVVPILTGLIVDNVVPHGDRHLLLILAVGSAGLVGFKFLALLGRSV
ncbi:MAG TPA: cysteine peptidase family C39 domain-containing protein, partial [Thermoanaerobaculia bacterium]